MTTFVLDASAILRFSDKEAGFDRVRDLFIQAAQGKVDLMLSAVNWGDIVAALYKRAGGLSGLTNNLAANLAALPLTIVALALHENATLVTADYDFKSVPSGTIKIEFLPAK